MALDLDARKAEAASAIEKLVAKWRALEPDDEYLNPTPAALDKLLSLKGCFCGPNDIAPDADGGIVVYLGNRDASLHIDSDGNVVLLAMCNDGLSFWKELD